MKTALGLNAIFSALSGALLIAFHNTVADFFDVTNSDMFWVIGVTLIFFSGTIVYEIKRQNALAILWIITQDLLWVIGSIVILVWQPFDLSVMGNYSIAAVALVVSLIALNQSMALAQVDTVNSKGDKQFNFRRTIAAPNSETWKVISDVANYHQVAPNIDDVKIISGKGEGMVRNCSHGNESWSETCAVWEEEKTYSFVVNTAAPDYPYPFKLLKGTWRLEEVDSNHTTITMTFDFSYRMKIQNLLLHPILKGKFKNTAKKLLDNWQGILEKNAQQKS